MKGTIFKNQISKESREEAKKNIRKIENVAEGSKRIIFQTRSVFPFDLFPDSIIVDENKVDIIVSTFFATNQSYSIPIANINGVVVTNALFFASFFLEISGYNVNPPTVKFLPAGDASKAKQYINGLVVCHKEKINVNDMETEYLKKKLIEIGKAQP
ncbi:MAG: hypothetical protein WC489_02025 [Patescibacteria group bacterium]